MGSGVGDAMEMSLEEGQIVLAPVRRRTRAGWDEASKDIAESADDALVWPEFGNAEDETLDW